MLGAFLGSETEASTNGEVDILAEEVADTLGNLKEFKAAREQDPRPSCRAGLLSRLRDRKSISEKKKLPPRHVRVRIGKGF